MSLRRHRLSRVTLLVTLAALVPVSAFALDGGSGSTAEASGLSVSASLGSCGVAGSQIYCSIDVSFTGVPGADYYTASVTRADGSVQDFGQVAQGESGGGTSLYVPYVGAGTYSVRIAAYGTPPGADDSGGPKLLDRESATTPADGFQAVPNGQVRKAGGSPSADAPSATDNHQAPPQATPDDGSSGATPPADPGAAPDAPAPDPPTPTEPAAPPTVTLPACQPAPAPAPAESGGEASADSGSAAAEATPTAGPPTECTTPSQDASGSCCPPGA